MTAIQSAEKDVDDKTKGQTHCKTCTNARKYIVESYDFADTKYAANIISQNIYDQCDIHGDHNVFLDTIIHSKKDRTIVTESKSCIVVNSKKYLRKTPRDGAPSRVMKKLSRVCLLT